jgi:hypothetical protein
LKQIVGSGLCTVAYTFLGYIGNVMALDCQIPTVKKPADLFVSEPAHLEHTGPVQRRTLVAVRPRSDDEVILRILLDLAINPIHDTAAVIMGCDFV